jgi:D-alanyl-D-alanine carboxypeptidase (penicillin-binding protein 5/6)
VSAAEALLVESDTGATVYARNAGREVAIASVTKMMTAYVTLEREPLARRLVEQPYDAGPGESIAGLVPGRHYSVRQMLEGMLLPSGNDVAYSLAIDVGGSMPHFLAEMNAAAAALHLGDTHFATPIGLDTPGNYSTARDLARLAEILLRDRAFARIVRKPVAYLPGGIVVRNRDTLLGVYPFVVGVKEGHTSDAGWCFVGAASRHGVHLVSVVLGEQSESSEFADTVALLSYGLSLYHRVRFAIPGHVYATVPANGATQQVALVVASPAALVLRRGVHLDVTLSGVPAQLDGPVAAGTQEGEIVVSVAGREALHVPLVTRDALPAPAGATGPTIPSPGFLRTGVLGV